MQKVIPSPSISFDTLDVMQQSRLSCGPSVTTGRERERAAVISNFDLMWFNFDMNMNMTAKMNWLSFSVKGNWTDNKQPVTQYTSSVFLICGLFIIIFF